MNRIKFILLAFMAIATLSCVEKPEKPEQKPTALTAPDVVTGEITENSISVSWNAVENSIGFEFKLTESADIIASDSVGVETLNATIGELKPETKYVFQIRAIGDNELYLDSEWKKTEITTTVHVPTYVEFADEVFKNFIFSMEPAVDADGNGIISFEEAATVKEINAGFEYEEDVTEDNAFTNLAGLEYFTSLEVLNLKWHRVSDATPVEGLTTLISLNLGENPISKIDISKLVNLTDLRLYGTSVSTLALDKTPLIKTLYLQRTALTELDLSPLTSLEEAAINEAKLKTLKAVGLKELARLDAVKNELTSVEISDCDVLMQLHLNSNKLESVSLSKLPKLMILNLYGNNLTSLDVAALPFLMTLFVFDNQLTSVDFSSNALLRNVMVSNNPIESLDFSNNEQLMQVIAEDMSKLKVLNLKNGAYFDEWENEYEIVNGNTALTKVIVDEGEEFDFVSELFKNNPSVKVVTE